MTAADARIAYLEEDSTWGAETKHLGLELLYRYRGLIVVRFGNIQRVKLELCKGFLQVT